MIQGVNHQVVEITRPDCEYFERVIFFVKPEFSSVSSGTLRERASKMASSASAPPSTKIKEKKFVFAMKLLAAAAVGATAAVLITRFAF